MKTQKKNPQNLQKREIFLIFAADLKHNLFEYTNKKQTLRNVLSSPLDDIVYTVDIDEEGNHHNFQAHSIEDFPEDYLSAEDSYYESEPPYPPHAQKGQKLLVQGLWFLRGCSVFSIQFFSR